MTPRLDLLQGARIQGVALVPDTGLLALTLFGDGRELRLGIGLGPRLVGIGLLPSQPSFLAPSTHPLVAAIRAHLVGHRVRSILEEDGEIFLAAGGQGAIARLVLAPARKGEARVLDIGGKLVVRWSPSKASPFPPLEVDGDDLDEAGRLLVETSDKLSAEAARRALAQSLRAQVKRLSRRAEAVGQDLARLDDAPRLQRIGRMLLAQGDKIPRGAKEAILDDWETGGLLEVKLDPAEPAKTQGTRFFERARKLLRGEQVMRARLEETEAQLAKARSLEAEVLEAEEVDRARLEAWAREARKLGARSAQSRQEPRAKAKKEAPRLPYATYRGTRGAKILVGRGAKENDALTLRIAKPYDLFLHARGVPGAHIIVPLQRGASCPPDLLVDAALLAAYHSEARGENPVEITYAERRHVRKTKGAPPGQVKVEREKVMLLRLDAEKLARLLQSKEE